LLPRLNALSSAGVAFGASGVWRAFPGRAIYIETPFSIENGNGTMNFMLTLGALGAMPLGFVLTVLIGAAISALHALIMIHEPMATS
jgi:hypothetical protein